MVSNSSSFCRWYITVTAPSRHPHGTAVPLTAHRYPSQDAHPQHTPHSTLMTPSRTLVPLSQHRHCTPLTAVLQHRHTGAPHSTVTAPHSTPSQHLTAHPSQYCHSTPYSTPLSSLTSYAHSTPSHHTLTAQSQHTPHSTVTAHPHSTGTLLTASASQHWYSSQHTVTAHRYA